MLGDNIKLYRNLRGYSCSQLAKEIGVSQGYLSDIENNNKLNPSNAIIALIATNLCMSTDVLLGTIPYTKEFDVYEYLPLNELIEYCSTTDHSEENAKVKYLVNRQILKCLLELKELRKYKKAMIEYISIHKHL